MTISEIARTAQAAPKPWALPPSAFQRPGPFGNLSFAIGSYDGLYELDFIARNIGYRDQSYWANLSQAGYQYLTVSFDQTPHIYNNNATTIFQNPGSAVLSVPAGLTQVLTGLPAPPATNAQQQTALDAINNNLTAFRLGFIRDTTEADYHDTGAVYDLVKRLHDAPPRRSPGRAGSCAPSPTSPPASRG